MVVYQVSVMAHGPVRIRKVQEGDISGEVVFLFGEKAARIFEQITREGISVIEDNPELAHILDFTHGRPIRETVANAHPGVHAVIFG
ncbi:hypothetical protein [Type-D symbiont of Plautia stali]|uniref:hypothetical protein n=1 Tax=Type-D symbiont of Plautia stali TaxID=1560356 RepID=UPI00073E68F4|nr:hypothetical protein [Type-D symbiont of Plautia stali]